MTLICIDCRILCYLLVTNNKKIGGKNKKTKNKKQKWLQSEKTIIDKLGLTKGNMKELKTLFEIITDEIGADKPTLFPIIQSKEFGGIGFKKEQFDDYNQNIVVSDEINNGFVKIDGDIINILMGDLEKELDEKGLLYQTRNISGSKKTKAWFHKYDVCYIELTRTVQTMTHSTNT